MIALPANTTILIIGAGPSGLMMAAQLLRYGVTPVIIDSRQGPTNQSKALAVQARSLEIYRQMGIVDKVLAEGKQAGGIIFNEEGKEAARLSLTRLKDTGTLYPFIQMYPQSRNERLLLDFLTVNCCPVYWETTLTALKQTADVVTVNVESNGTEHSIVCNYVVGADGAHSIVRKQSGIPFNGDTYQHRFYLADLQIDSDLAPDMVQLFLSEKGFAGFFPLPDDGSYRIVGSLPDDFDAANEGLLEDILPHLKAVTKAEINVVHNNWFTIYKLHHRMAAQFALGRCYLIGDAAHIHSPVGGQGMNTGLQDACNLAWKLAGVVNGQLGEAVLNSYAAERMPVAKDLLNTTDRIFNIITSRSWFSGVLKKYVIPAGLKFLWKNEKFRALFFRRVSQTGINYRESKLNLHLSSARHVKAGDRLPYLSVFDEKKQQQTDLHSWCSKPGFTLITFGIIKDDYLFTLAKWITQHYQGRLNFFHLPFSNKNQNVFDVFEVSIGKRKVLIIRPDMHIGYMNDVVDIELMNNYLLQVAGFLQ